MLNKTVSHFILVITLCVTFNANVHANPEHYIIDTTGMHAFIQFKIKHLGFSWLLGRFDKFSGKFTYDAAHQINNKVQVKIDVSSLDSNQAERDKHLRSAEYFDVDKYPTARFVSTGYTRKTKTGGILHGKFTLRGVTKNIDIAVKQIGGGKDPWGGFRRGFEGTTTLHLSDYKMAKAGNLGPYAENVELSLYIEGVRQ